MSNSLARAVRCIATAMSTVAWKVGSLTAKRGEPTTVGRADWLVEPSSSASMGTQPRTFRINGQPQVVQVDRRLERTCRTAKELRLCLPARQGDLDHALAVDG